MVFYLTSLFKDKNVLIRFDTLRDNKMDIIDGYRLKCVQSSVIRLSVRF